MKMTMKGKVIPTSNTCHRWKDSITISIDLKAKWAIIDCTGSNDDIPLILLSYDKETLHLTKSKKDDTILEFPEFKGWDIMCSQISKYNLIITFVKLEE